MTSRNHPFPFEKSRLKLGKGGSASVWLGRDVYEEEEEENSATVEEVSVEERREDNKDGMGVTTSDFEKHQKKQKEKEKSRRYVAIKKKFLHPHRGEEFKANEDEEEHRIIAHLGNHPHILPLYSWVEYDGYVHFALELMHSDLSNEFSQGDHLCFSEDICRQIMWPVLKAVAHCHRRGVAHRDIKPSNILLQRCVEQVEEDAEDLPSNSPQSWRLALADFGVAHFVTPVERPAMSYRGTRLYQPPETLLGRVKAEDCYGSDMWAVGCTMCELLSGARVFQGDTAIAILSDIFDKLGSSFQDFPRQTKPTLLFEEIKQRVRKNLKNKWESSSSSSSLSTSMFDLMSRLLALHVRDRISAEEALCHSFFSEAGYVYQRRGAAAEMIPHEEVATTKVFDHPPPAGEDIQKGDDNAPPLEEEVCSIITLSGNVQMKSYKPVNYEALSFDPVIKPEVVERFRQHGHLLSTTAINQDSSSNLEGSSWLFHQNISGSSGNSSIQLSVQKPTSCFSASSKHQGGVPPFFGSGARGGQQLHQRQEISTAAHRLTFSNLRTNLMFQGKPPATSSGLMLSPSPSRTPRQKLQFSPQASPMPPPRYTE